MTPQPINPVLNPVLAGTPPGAVIHPPPMRRSVVRRRVSAKSPVRNAIARVRVGELMVVEAETIDRPGH
jgi:hypothetical protein